MPIFGEKKSKGLDAQLNEGFVNPNQQPSDQPQRDEPPLDESKSSSCLPFLSWFSRSKKPKPETVEDIIKSSPFRLGQASGIK